MLTRKPLIGCIFVLLSCSLQHAVAQDHVSRARTLNEQSIKLLGVDLATMVWLLQAREGSYLLKSALEKSGDYARLQALQKQGYLRIQIVTGLPDGTERKTDFVRIMPTLTGVEILDVLRK